MGFARVSPFWSISAQFLALSPVFLLFRWFDRSVSVDYSVMEEVGHRFAGSLVLTERESKGVRIRATALQCLFAVSAKWLHQGLFGVGVLLIFLPGCGEVEGVWLLVMWRMIVFFCGSLARRIWQRFSRESLGILIDLLYLWVC